MIAHNTVLNTRAEVLEIIREMPGVSSVEILQLMPHVSKASVFSMVHLLKKQGVITVNGSKTMRTGKVERKLPTFVLGANPTPNVVRMKRKAPTEAGLNMQIKDLNERIAELEAWKRDAIARYPDLAVEPVVLKARKIVADEVRAGGDAALADHILRGLKDETLMMRVTIKALEEAE